MNLKFKIHWFENDIDFIDSNESKILEISEFLIDFWFMPEIVFYFDEEHKPRHRFLSKISSWSISGFKITKVQDYSETSISGIDFNEPDLVLMDYDLGGEWKWDDIIRYIRDNQNSFYTEVLFYSQSIPPSDFSPPRSNDKIESYLRHVADRDATYCCHRSKVFEKLGRVLTTLFRKSQDLNNLRGLVMSETSDIDAVMRNIIQALGSKYAFTLTPSTTCRCWNNSCRCSKWRKTQIKQGSFLLAEINGHQTDIGKALLELESSKQMYEAINQYLQSSLNCTTIAQLPPYATYRNETNRVVFAHYPEITWGQNNMTIVDDAGVPHTYNEAEFKQIRKDVLKYKNIFLSILTSI